MNPVALVTGGSRGIGRGVALALAAEGYDLVINFVSQSKAAARTALDCKRAADSAGYPIGVECCRADLADRGARDNLVAFSRQTFGRIDLLVNNAGVAPTRRADILEADEASFDRLIGINVKGPYFLTQQIARWMIEQGSRPHPESGPRPKIITISSISAYAASVNRGDYCLAKAALSMLTPLFAARLAEHGIQVHEIRPGIMDTDMTRPVKSKYDRLIEAGLTPIRRWGTPEDVGRAVVAIARDSFPFSTGDIFNIDGGFHLRIL